MAQGKLYGKNIILTGASRGFGQYLAGRLWDEGASLLLVARSDTVWVTLSERDGQICETERADLGMTGAVDDVAAHALRMWPNIGIDGLVNNAAIQGPVGKAWEVDPLEWDDVINLDLIVPFLLCRITVPEMLKQKHGKIVNLSGGGAANSRPNYSAYATAKAGLVRFSECLAEELKGTGIDVNCVAPGKMPTGMLSPEEIADDEMFDTDSMRKAADLIIFLLSDESNGITGRLISAIWDDWRSFPQYIERLKADPDVFTLRREIGWRE